MKVKKNNKRVKTVLIFSLVVLGACQFRLRGQEGHPTEGDHKTVSYQIQLDTLWSDNNDSMCWFQPRAGVIPGRRPKIVMTVQRFIIGHSDVYEPLVYATSIDNGRSWSAPDDKEDAFYYQKAAGGVYVGQCDFTPKWHKYAKVLLGTGHTVHYKNRHLVRGLGRETVYSVFDAAAGAWSKARTLKMPDDPVFYNSGAGAAQRVDLPDGDVLLPLYCKEKGTEQYHSTVVRCGFDGKNLTYKEHGNLLTVPIARGLYEPSLTCYNGTYYLTMRNDSSGYYAVSTDGLHFGRPKIWHFDTGKEVGSYNTQQHWVTHSDGLFLVYTRRAKNNTNVVRSRAPLFIAQVDTAKMVLLKQTEQIVIPNRGAPLGNFGVTEVGQDETWVTVAEGMRKTRLEQMKFGANGNVFAGRILWNKPNRDQSGR